MFKRLENARAGTRLALDDAFANLKFSEQGLIPAIAQQHDTGEVLMLAWMSEASIRETLTTGHVCYWSRSRARLWRKGERSGQVQRLVELRLDCDGDTVLLLVDQTGPACHTGRRSCFYWSLQGDRLELRGAPLRDPEELYGQPPERT
jgi:phosphoribosyl-AMP cyclohydrolase